MRILLLGSGGRESALAAALDRSRSVSEVVAAPGNPGIARFATCISVDPEDPVKIMGLARQLKPDLVVVGPEGPLVAGVGDALRGGEGRARLAAFDLGEQRGAHAGGLAELPQAEAHRVAEASDARPDLERVDGGR